MLWSLSIRQKAQVCNEMCDILEAAAEVCRCRLKGKVEPLAQYGRFSHRVPMYTISPTIACPARICAALRVIRYGEDQN